jgi:hypothetical protein
MSLKNKFIGGTIILELFLAAYFLASGISKERAENKPSISKASINADIKIRKANAAEDSIFEILSKKVKQKFPNDFYTQECWINQQMKDYEYMLNCKDVALKEKAQRNLPLDFSAQKYYYDDQTIKDR